MSGERMILGADARLLDEADVLLGRSFFKKIKRGIKKAAKKTVRTVKSPKRLAKAAVTLSPAGMALYAAKKAKRVVSRKPKKSAAKRAKATALNKRVAVIAKTQPAQSKKAVGILAAQDQSINAGKNMYLDMKDPETKPEAQAAYDETLEQAQAGNPEAQKAIATVSTLATSDAMAPGTPDSDIDDGMQAYEESQIYDAEQEPLEDEPEDEPEEQDGEIEGESGDDGEIMLGGLITMGFSFGKLLKKAVKAVKPLAKTARSVAAMTPYGAAVNAAMNMAPAGLKTAASMLQQAQRGDRNSLAKINQVKALASAGSSQGKAALKTLQQAKTFTNSVVRAAKQTLSSPSAVLSVPKSSLPQNVQSMPGAQGAGPVQIFIMMPGQDAVKTVLSAAQQAGSKFWIPATSLYREGLTR